MNGLRRVLLCVVAATLLWRGQYERTPGTERFMAAVKPTGLAVEPRLTQVVDPPSYDIMAEMIDVVAREMTQ